MATLPKLTLVGWFLGQRRLLCRSATCNHDARVCVCVCVSVCVCVCVCEREREREKERERVRGGGRERESAQNWVRYCCSIPPRAVVPDEELLRAIEGEGHVTEALFSELRPGRAQAVLVPTACDKTQHAIHHGITAEYKNNAQYKNQYLLPRRCTGMSNTMRRTMPQLWRGVDKNSSHAPTVVVSDAPSDLDRGASGPVGHGWTLGQFLV
jgi:hypothetical protein